MAKINNFDDFEKLTSNITSFSHAYLFDTNSLSNAYPYILLFAKKIICDNHENDEEYQDICYQIDNDEFDDVYVVNPTTIGINTEEIEKLLLYMTTKSLRDNGRRVYIIYGFERLSSETSNKILKFLEEPNDNIYALLMTENIDKILPTIISRCQKISLSFNVQKINDEITKNMQNFLLDIIDKRQHMIAYSNQYFENIIGNRKEFYDNFEVLEKILSMVINQKCGINSEINGVDKLVNLEMDKLVNILDITNKLKCLIKQNINLNLLIDRYIIEVSKELI